eukprot:scaffold1452_cov117-Isochrysis_galbana.AAC.3
MLQMIGAPLLTFLGLDVHVVACDCMRAWRSSRPPLHGDKPVFLLLRMEVSGACMTQRSRHKAFSDTR